MLGLISFSASVFCSIIWLAMLFSRRKSGLVFGKSYEFYIFGSVALAVFATVLLRVGVWGFWMVTFFGKAEEQWKKL